jgi:hypothetical protein
LNGGRRSRELISPGGIRSYALPVQMNKLKAHPLSCMRYVVLPVDLLGVVRATYELECADDNDANLRAQPYLEAHSAIEIWRGRRCIAYLARKRGPIEASPIAVFDTEDGLSSLPAVEKNKYRFPLRAPEAARPSYPSPKSHTLSRTLESAPRPRYGASYLTIEPVSGLEPMLSEYAGRRSVGKSLKVAIQFGSTPRTRQPWLGQSGLAGTISNRNVSTPCWPRRC